MKKRFNWVDIGILLVLLAVVAVGYQYLNRNNTNQVTTQAVEVTVRVAGVKAETVEVIKTGDVFKDTDTNLVFGKVIDKKVSDAYDFAETAAGTIVKSKIPDRYTVHITLAGNAVVTEDSIKLGNRDVRYEGTLHLKSNINDLETIVTDIKIKN